MYDSKLMEKHTQATEVIVKKLAQSTTAGIWRIKRAKLILGAWSGEPVDKLVQKVRVPPQTINRCLCEFSEKGISYFDVPDRQPTSRESRAEIVLSFLNQQQDPSNSEWHTLSVHYIGRDFSAHEIQELRTFIALNPHLNCAQIAKELCMMFNLHQSNGKIKKSTAYNIIKRMAMDNIIKLPNTFVKPKDLADVKSTAKSSELIQTSNQITLNKNEIPELTFVLVGDSDKSALWREMMDRFHYINGTRLFGAQLRYLVYGGKEDDQPADCKGYLLGALSFSAGTLKLASRDQFIGWNDIQREKNLKLIVNNSRFLILPWIKSKYLASRILGGIARQLAEDWWKKYHYRPVLLETFVQKSRHSGTSYKAANWLQIGSTRDYSLYSSKRKNIPEKAVYIYPLHKRYKKILCCFD